MCGEGKTVSKSQKSLCWTLNVSFDDLGQTQKLKEREREERQWKNRGGERPFTSGKDSDRKPPICGQTAGGQIEWTLSAVRVGSLWGGGGGRESQRRGTLDVTRCLHGTEHSYTGRFGGGGRQLTCRNNCPRGCAQWVQLWQVPQPPLMHQCFHFPRCICHRLPLTAPQVCVQDEKCMDAQLTESGLKWNYDSEF